MKNVILIIISVAILAALLFFGLQYFNKLKEEPALTQEEQTIKNLGDDLDTIKNAATQSVLPDIKTDTNPLENKPDINPVDKANPFKDLKTNPFR